MTWYKFYIFLLIILTFSLVLIKAKVTVSFCIDPYTKYNDVFKTVVEEFNKHSEKNNLDIELKLTSYTDSIASINLPEILSSLGDNDDTYDIIVYDTVYLNTISPYLLELDEYLPKNLTDLYSSKKNKMLTYHNDHIRGLPLLIYYSLLFSNNIYLQRYNMEVPRTWDQLIDTTSYILSEEQKRGNKDLTGYTALFPDNNISLSSFYQFLYSYRDNMNDNIPEYTSQNAKDAMNKLIEIKNKISNNELFQMSKTDVLQQILEEKTLFTHFYNTIRLPHYTNSILPGKKEGISASRIGGYNVGIYKKISEEKLNPSLEVIKYINSKQFQKDLIINKLGHTTSIEELYDDPEVCENVNINCDILKNAQYYSMLQDEHNKDYYILQDTNEHKKTFNDKALPLIQDLLNGKVSVDEFLSKSSEISGTYLNYDNKFYKFLFIFVILYSCLHIL